MIEKELDLYNIKINSSKRYFKYKRYLIVGLGAVAIFVVGGYSIHNIRENNVMEEKGESNTLIKEKIEIATNAKISTGYIEETIYDEMYKHYIDEEFNFYCAIPAHFTLGESIGGGNRITLASPNNDAFMFIGATLNSLGLSAKDVMNQYIADAGDQVDYNDYGDTWYVVSKTVDGTSYYRKCFVEDTIRWFEFSIKETSAEPYGKYIEYIEDNFKKSN